MAHLFSEGLSLYYLLILLSIFLFVILSPFLYIVWNPSSTEGSSITPFTLNESMISPSVSGVG